MRSTPACRLLLIGTSISRNFPPSGTAGLARLRVRGQRREPCPPPRMAVTTLWITVSLADEGARGYPCRAAQFNGLGQGRIDAKRRVRRALRDGDDPALHPQRRRTPGSAARTRHAGAAGEAPRG